MSTHHLHSARAVAIAAAALATFALTACSPQSPTPGPDRAATASAAPSAGYAPAESAAIASEILASHGLDGLTAREVVEKMDALAVDERPSDLMLSVRPNELVVMGAGGEEGALPMPDDAFYVSLAPYVSSTHDCYFHSLTTCKGEMSGEDVHVVVTDAATGDILIDEVRTTYDNGFVGLWLPKGIDAVVEIEAEGRSASATLSTRNADDATCVTTMQLT